MTVESTSSATEIGTFAVIATTIAVIAWFNTDLTGIQRVTSTTIVWLVAFGAAVVGLRLFG